MFSRAAGRPVICAALVPVLLSWCFCLRADPGWQLSAKDSGKDPRVAVLLGRLQQQRVSALGIAGEGLGLSPGKLPIRWVLRLADSSPSDSSVEAEAGWTEVGEKEIVVSIPAWRYLDYPAKAGRVVVHEAVHALMASRLGSGDAYRSLPRWFREGTALLVSREGDARVQGRIAAAVLAGGRPASFLTGIHCGKPGSSVTGCSPSPAEGYLAVRWLEDRLGKTGLRELLSRLSAGGSFTDELGQLTGLRTARLEGALLAHAAEAISRLASKDCRRLFAEALALCRSGKNAPARELFNAISKAPGNKALRDTAVFLHSRTLVEDGACRQAIVALEGLLKEGYEVPWEPEIFEQLGRCRRALGEPARARQLWKTVTERFPHDREIQARIAILLKRPKAGGE